MLDGLSSEHYSFRNENKDNFDIQMDRSINPHYNFSEKAPLDSQPQFLGPSNYNLKEDVTLWLHEKQQVGHETGDVIYKHLKDTQLLENCLDLQDLINIQAKSPRVFNELFSGKRIFAWNGVGRQSRDSNILVVPYLTMPSDFISLRWRPLSSKFNCTHGALIFTKF